MEHVLWTLEEQVIVGLHVSRGVSRKGLFLLWMALSHGKREIPSGWKMNEILVCLLPRDFRVMELCVGLTQAFIPQNTGNLGNACGDYQAPM